MSILDLDNTLVDRSAALARWAARYVADLGGQDTDVAWLIAYDRDGYAPKAELGAAIRDRFGLRAEPAAIVRELRAGIRDEVRIEPGVAEALRLAAAAGFVPFVVTNGTVRQQEAKLRTTGLDRLVAGWVISEAAGMEKPDPAIFQLAAERAGLPLTGGWMVGDHCEFDVGAAARLGMATVWLDRGRTWPQLPYRPTRVAADCATAITTVVQTAATVPLQPFDV